MSKCCMLAFSLIFTMYGMENEKFLLQDFHRSFKDLVVLDYNCDEHNAFDLAKVAKSVHLNITGKSEKEVIDLQEKYNHVPNLLFTKPHHQLYDAIIIQISNKSLYVLPHIRSYLKTNGEVHAFIGTQKYFPSFVEAVLLELYPEIYALSSENIKEQMKDKYRPNRIESTLKSKYCTDEEIKEDIWGSGYDVISCEEVGYEIITSKIKIKKTAKTDFLNYLENAEISQEITRDLCKKYIALMLSKCKNDEDGNFLIPIKATKFKLHDYGNVRLRLNWNPMWGPKEAFMGNVLK